MKIMTPKNNNKTIHELAQALNQSTVQT